MWNASSFFLLQAGSAVTLGLASLALGLPFARRLGCLGVTERCVWGLVLGLLGLAHTLLWLALGGLFNGWALALVAAGSVAWGSRDLLRLAAEARAGAAPRSRRSRAVALGIAVPAIAPLALIAAYPPFEWDETIYHLVWARSIVEQQGLVVQPQLRVPAFPPLAELLQAVLLVVGDDVAAHWVSWWATLGTAGLLLVWAGLEGDRRSGGLAAALHLGSPIVVFLAGCGYVDALLTLWVTAALAAAARARATGDRRWWIAAGACVGGAAGVKYLGVFFVGWLGVEAFCTAAGGWRGRFADALRVAGPALVSAAPVYAWIHAVTGSPLFPFYPEVFGESPWSYVPAEPGPGLGARLLAALTLPWKSLAARPEVGWMPPYSPFWLLALAVALAGAAAARRWRWTLAMGIVYLLAIPANSRYLLPLLPVVGLAGVATLAARRPQWWRSPAVAGLLAASLFAPGWAYALRLRALRGPVPVTRAARDAFLAERLPCYAALQSLNAAQGESYSAYGMRLERLAGLATGTWYGDVTGPWSFDRVAAALDRQTPVRDALAGTGAGWVVVPETWKGRFVAADPEQPPRLAFDDGVCAVLELRPPASPGPR